MSTARSLKMGRGRVVDSKVLVTGADGFVGSELSAELVRRDARVVKAKRSSESGGGSAKRVGGFQYGIGQPSSPSLESVVVGDIGPNTDWSGALRGVEFVVHLAARVHMMDDEAVNPLAEFRRVNVEGTRRLAEAAARAGVKRFVFLSSVKVNGESTGDGKGPFNGTDQAHPEDDYGLSKWEAEQVLREVERQTRMEVVVIRPPLIYGPGVKANFLSLVRLVEKGVPLPLGGIRNKRSLLGLTNMVDLICCCLEHPRAACETFLASDGEDVSTPELARRIAQALGKSARLVPLPMWLMRMGGAMAGKSKDVARLCDSLQIDSSRLRRVLDWFPPSTMAEELSRVAAWRHMCGGART